MAEEVKILDERTITHFPKPNQPQLLRAVTYQIGNQIPRVVYIPEPEYTEDRLKAEIKADQEKARISGARVISL